MDEQKVSMPPNNSVPVGVKVISVVYYLASIGLIAFGALGLLTSVFLVSSFAALGAGYAAGLGAIPGLFMLAFGLLAFYIGRGLWKGKKWASILTITISASSLVVGIIDMLIIGTKTHNYFGYIYFIPQIIVVLYLILNQKVKTAFQQNDPKKIGLILSIIFVIAYGIFSSTSLRLKYEVVQLVEEFNLSDEIEVKTSETKYEQKAESIQSQTTQKPEAIQNIPTLSHNEPDFIPANLKISPASLTKGAVGTITFIVKNIGNGTNNLFEESGYSIYYNGNNPSWSDFGDSTCVSEDMGPNSQCEVTLLVSYDTIGTKTIGIIVDSAKIIKELDENNNWEEINFQVN